MDLVLRTYVYVLTTAHLVGERVSERLNRDERGLVALEWAGILLIVAALVLAIAQSNLKSTITEKVAEAVTNLFTAAT
jgi:hypothetical protein